MYNLIISANEDAFKYNYITLDKDRCINEYTDKEIKVQFSKLDLTQIRDIKKLPTLFCNEIGINSETYLGEITNITIKQNQLKIDFRIKDKFIPNTEIRRNFLYDFGMGDNELTRTHWAIKDIDFGMVCKVKKIHVPDWIYKSGFPIDISKHQFKVALSFSGEYRDYVKQVANELERVLGKDSYFFDENYKAQLAMPSMDLLLQNIYSKQSDLIVVFFGNSYQKKEWCGIEFSAIRELILHKQKNRIMYIKMDEGKVAGILNIDGYIDARTTTSTEIASCIKERLQILENLT
jgi:hypothetical protein